MKKEKREWGRLAFGVCNFVVNEIRLCESNKGLDDGEWW